MKLLVATDAHIFETPDGKHWTPAIYGYSFWLRYLNVFDQVRVVARTKKVQVVPQKSLLVDGPNVEIFPIPFYQGPKQLLKVYIKIHSVLKNVAEGCDVAIFRMPSQTAYMTYEHVKGKLPIGGEIVYDPTDDLHRKDLNKFVHFLDIITSNRLKNFCRMANGVSYVTEKSIQEHYPSRARLFGESKEYFETFYSTITLSDDAFAAPRSFCERKPIKISFSNVSMNSNRKGESVLINAVKNARDKGYDITAVLIGDGTMRPTFESLAENLGIQDYIKFTGRLSSADEVRKVLMESDMFVFPSQAEGLPRGILEAMAVGLPVLSTPVGGIPEVIDSRYLFNPTDTDGFTNMICHLAENLDELEMIGNNNYKKAQEFRNSLLQKKRDDFYMKLARLKDR